MIFALPVIFALVEGGVCYYAAKRKGLRYPELWFVAGVTLQIFAFVLLWLALKRAAPANAGKYSNEHDEEYDDEDYVDADYWTETD